MKSILLLILLPLFTFGQDRDISHLSSGGKLHPLQAAMDMRHYTISLQVDITHQSIDGFTEAALVLAAPADTLLFDLIHLYKVSRILVDNKPASFLHEKDRIFITGSAAFGAGRHLVKIFYAGQPPIAVRPPWFGGFTFTKDSTGHPWVAINCQKEGARIYFACKDHPSDEPNEGVDMFITVPDSLVVAGPGLLQGVTKTKDLKTYHWKTNYTISGYTTVFNIGNYKVATDEYTTINGNKVPIQFYVQEEDLAQAPKIIELKKRDTRVLEKYFGEYPWVKEKIGIAEVPNPGMEHQTMITFQNKFVYSTIGGQPYSANLFHEYAHEWFANKVTNKDWAHEWIQEGIATYAEALIHYELGGQEAYDMLLARHRLSIKNKKPMVLANEGISEDETYNGSDIYTKGSFMMHSLRYIIGDAVFLPTLKKLATDPAYTYDNFVTTADVEQLFSKASDINLEPFFTFFTRTTDLLNFSVTQTEFRQYKVKLDNWFMDLPVDILGSAGTKREMLTKDGIVVNSDFPPVVDGKGYYLKRVVVR